MLSSRKRPVTMENHNGVTCRRPLRRHVVQRTTRTLPPPQAEPSHDGVTIIPHVTPRAPKDPLQWQSCVGLGQRISCTRRLAEERIRQSARVTSATMDLDRANGVVEHVHLLFPPMQAAPSAFSQFRRTFDVVPNPFSSLLPHVATIVQHDNSCQFPWTFHENMSIWLHSGANMEAGTIQAIRYGQDGLDLASATRRVGILSLGASATHPNYHFQCIAVAPAENQLRLGFDMADVCLGPVQANDFWMPSPSRVVFAANRLPATRQPEPREWHHGAVSACLEQKCVTIQEMRGFCPSDAVCIEPAEPIIGGTRTSQVVYFLGNKDGSVSLVDERSRDGCMNSGAESNVGAVLSLAYVSEHQVLARGGTHGSSRLLDLRMFDRGLHEFPMPPCSRVATQKCRGVAMDPCQTVVLSPFVSTNMEPKIGIWSLHSGTYLGCKSLAPDLDETCKRDVAVELCKTPTSAWEWKVYERSSVAQADRSLRKGAFGLWFKLTHSLAEDSMGIAMNVHQVSFCGRFDDCHTSSWQEPTIV